MRLLYGAFTPEETTRVYKSCWEYVSHPISANYTNSQSALEPGGWLEECEWDISVKCDDGSIPEDHILHRWGPVFWRCAEKSGRPLDTEQTMRASVEKAGFVNVHEKLYKCPIGGWPKEKIYKDAGNVNRAHWNAGLEGWSMWLLTKFGEPTPWNADEVQVWVAQNRAGLNDPKIHSYHFA